MSGKQCGLTRAVLGVCAVGSIVSAASRATAQSAPPASAPQTVAPAPGPAATPPVAPAPPPVPMPSAAPYPSAPSAYPAPGGDGYPPPPGYGYPPPGYAYPYSSYGYQRLMRLPDSVPYQGGPVPRGYHVEERSRRGLIIAGSLVLGIPWALGFSIVSGANYPNRTGWLLVPGLGPWITLAARHDSRCSGNGDCINDAANAATRTLLVLDGLMQTSGAVLLIVGLASKNTVVARDFVGSLRLTPASLGKQGYGGLVSGQF